MSNFGHAGRPTVIWFPEMIAALVALRSRRPRPANLVECARRIGVGIGTCRRKARELGLSTASYPGPAPGSSRVPRDALGRFVGPKVIQAPGKAQAAVAPPEAPQ